MKDNLKKNSNKFGNLSIKIKGIFTIVIFWSLDQSEIMKENKDGHTQLTIYKNKVFQNPKGRIKQARIAQKEAFQNSQSEYQFSKFPRTRFLTQRLHLLVKVWENQLTFNPKKNVGEHTEKQLFRGSGISLVRVEDDIKKIWQKLDKSSLWGHKNNVKLDYGDTEHCIPLWKISNLFKLRDTLTKVITWIKYIMNLATQHKIEDKLFTSERLGKMYNILGNSRLIACLSYSNEAWLTGEQEWLKFIQERSVNLSAKKFYSKKENTDINL